MKPGLRFIQGRGQRLLMRWSVILTVLGLMGAILWFSLGAPAAQTLRLERLMGQLGKLEDEIMKEMIELDSIPSPLDGPLEGINHRFLMWEQISPHLLLQVDSLRAKIEVYEISASALLTTYPRASPDLKDALALTSEILLSLKPRLDHIEKSLVRPEVDDHL